MTPSEQAALLPCPFCGGEARTFHYNGTTQATCAKEHVECAGTDVCAPVAMWNTRDPSAYRAGHLADTTGIE